MTNNETTMRSTALTAAAACAVLLLAACTGHKKDTTQSAARVDGTEITVHQINYKLQRERGLRPEQQEEAARKVLEQLIDEQLIVEKAEKTKMDLEPGAQQALDAARREVLARAYVDITAQSVTPPSDAAVHAYYDANPYLFGQRRVYTLQEYLAKVPEDKIPALRAMVEAGRPPEETEAWFKAQGAPFRAQQSTQPAERIPMGSLKEIAAIPVGHGLVASAGNQVHVTYVTSSTDAPAPFDVARPKIMQFLAIESRKKVTEGNVAALRTAAKIEYAPQYAALAASGAALATTKDIESTPSPLTTASGTHVSLPAANEASSVQVTLPTTTSSSVRVSLPQSQGVRVSLPATPASSVQVRLPAPASQDATKK
jgi:EpsD family peptidyl-prolyl cis-trans isomerase